MGERLDETRSLFLRAAKVSSLPWSGRSHYVGGTNDLSSWSISVIVCVGTACGFIAFSTNFWHWFVIPVTLGSIIITQDAVEWFRRRTDVFDPTGWVGLYGVHYFLMAPFLHVAWDYWYGDRFAPSDWRPWIGWIAVVNLVGLVGFRWSRRVTMGIVLPPRTCWRINKTRALFVMPSMFAFAGLLQIWIYWKFGGVSGFVEAHDQGALIPANPFQGYGALFSVADSFPMLLSFSYVMVARWRPAWRTWPAILAVLLAQLASEIIFGGLRGNRSNVVIGMFWTIGLIHLFVKPLGRKHVLAGIVSIVLYMNVAYFYKHGGIDAFLNIMDAGSRAKVTGVKGVDDERKFVVLHDFARTDIQALALYVLSTSDDYELAMGRSYAAALVAWVPRAVWPDRPQNVRKERTELLYGQRSPNRHYPDATVPIIFGASGEAMLNFGRWSAPIPIVLWGVFVGWATVIYRRMSREDARSLMLPFTIVMSIVVLIGDSHNQVQLLATHAAIPFFALWLITDKVKAHER